MDQSYFGFMILGIICGPILLLVLGAVIWLIIAAANGQKNVVKGILIGFGVCFGLLIIPGALAMLLFLGVSADAAMVAEHEAQLAKEVEMNTRRAEIAADSSSPISASMPTSISVSELRQDHLLSHYPSQEAAVKALGNEVLRRIAFSREEKASLYIDPSIVPSHQTLFLNALQSVSSKIRRLDHEDSPRAATHYELSYKSLPEGKYELMIAGDERAEVVEVKYDYAPWVNYSDLITNDAAGHVSIEAFDDDFSLSREQAILKAKREAYFTLEAYLQDRGYLHTHNEQAAKIWKWLKTNETLVPSDNTSRFEFFGENLLFSYNEDVHAFSYETKAGPVWHASVRLQDVKDIEAAMVSAAHVGSAYPAWLRWTNYHKLFLGVAFVGAVMLYLKLISKPVNNVNMLTALAGSGVLMLILFVLT